MNREWSLFAGFLGVVVAAALLAATVPGVIAEQDAEYRRSALDLRDIGVSHGQVGGETIPLTVEARVQHDGGPAENVTVLFRADGLESGLRETSETVAIGTVEGDREVPVRTNLTVARRGGYEIEVVVFEDGARRSTGSTQVAGVGSLTPAYAQTSVDFHRFDGGEYAPPTVEYSIAGTTDDRTTLNVSSYLTNSGDAPSEDVRLVVKARQADSNIVAAKRTVSVGQIDPGRTATPHTELTVPAEYNYYLDAVLWKDGVIVGSTRSAANLDPTETVSVDETRRDVGLRVSDFESGASGGPGDRSNAREEATSTEQGPGFGIGAAALALLASVVVLARRGDRHD